MNFCFGDLPGLRPCGYCNNCILNAPTRLFYESIDQLPESADDFFKERREVKTLRDLKARRHELRLAFKKYPKRSFRIEAMARWITSGIEKCERSYAKNQEPDLK